MVPALELDVGADVGWTWNEVNLLGLIVARMSGVAELVHHAFTDAEDPRGVVRSLIMLQLVRDHGRARRDGVVTLALGKRIKGSGIIVEVYCLFGSAVVGSA